jgi:acyl carrier protein
MSTDPAAVEKTISEFLDRVEKAPENLTPDLVLHADGIGLNSLEIAELSAVLEDEFGTDPFSGDEMPETVGDIYAFYAASA